MMTRSLRRLKEQIVKANLLAQEAGFFAEELNKKTEYLVTLQIPAANLDANRKVGASTNARKRNGFIPFYVSKLLIDLCHQKITLQAGRKSRSYED